MKKFRINFRGPPSFLALPLVTAAAPGTAIAALIKINEVRGVWERFLCFCLERKWEQQQGQERERERYEWHREFLPCVHARPVIREASGSFLATAAASEHFQLQVPYFYLLIDGFRPLALDCGC